jgi:hypothetical protein
MFSFNIKTCIVTGIVLFALFSWRIAEARPAGEYYLAVNAKDKSAAPNEFTSILGLKISDEIISPKFPTRYELDARINYERENDIRNNQYSGNIEGKYIFVQPSLWWNYTGEVNVIPLNRLIDIDNLTSQNISTISTGPTLSLWKNLRGSVDISALHSITNYSESNLDSGEDEISLEYIYPYSEIMSATYSLDYQSVKYDDVSNSASDYDSQTAGVKIERETLNSNFEFTFDYSNYDGTNSSSQENSIGLIMGYQINSISSILMEMSNSIETADDFNRLDNNTNDAIFRSGIFRNKRFALGYEHVTLDTSYRFRVFTNNLESIFDAVPITEKISGATFKFSSDINDELSILMSLESTDEETIDRRRDEIRAAAIYTRRHSKRLKSQVAIGIENDRVNSISTNDTSIQYRLTSALF